MRRSSDIRTGGMSGVPHQASIASSSLPSLKPYTVLARRYRSRDFDEIVGQEPIARTLHNAIKTGAPPTRTSSAARAAWARPPMARIFAKALNATDDLKEKKQIGDAILRGEDLDVIEIDGASYRGVNEARNSSPAPASRPRLAIQDLHHRRSSQLTKEPSTAAQDDGGAAARM